MAWTKSATLTIDHTKTPSTLTDFPFPFDVTDTVLKLVAGGGSVTNASGFDIALFSDVGLTTLMKFERIKYDSTAGRFYGVVKVPSLSSSADTVIYLAVGNSAITTDQSDRANTWNTNFAAVYHASVTDSTSHANTLTAVAAPGTAAGLLGDARTYDGSTQYDWIPLASPVTAYPFTLTSLFFPTTLKSAGLLSVGSILNATLDETTLQTSGAMRGTTLGGNATTTTALITVNTWSYAAGRFVASNNRFIKANLTAATQSTAATTNTGTRDGFSVGSRVSLGHSNFFQGSINESRIYSSDPGDDWLVAEYNSLVGTATFYVKGAFSNTPPVAAITAPVATGGSTSAAYGASVSFAGTGTDAEDGTLTGASLVWTSSLNPGTIGTGVSFSTSTLFAGVHTITLTATDSGAATGTATITLTITSAAQTTLQAFFNANGGDSTWLGYLDYRVNATDAGSGRCSAWDDIRGPGTGKAKSHVQATGGSQPLITASGVQFVASRSDHLLSALDTRLTMDQAAALHFFAVLRSAGGNVFTAVMSQDPTSTASLPYETLATGSANYVHLLNCGSSGTANLVTQPIGVTALDSTVRGVIFGRQQTDAAGGSQYVYESRVAGTTFRRREQLPVAPATASGMKTCLARFGTTYADCTWLAFGYSNQTLTDTLLANWNTLIANEYGAVLDRALKTPVKWIGNSTDRAHNTTHAINDKGDVASETGVTSALYLGSQIAPTFASMGFDTDLWAESEAANGKTLTQMIAEYAYMAKLDYDSLRAGRNIITLGGLNADLITNATYTGVGGGALYVALLDSFLTTLHTDGVYVLLNTINDISSWYTGAKGSGGVLNQLGTNAVFTNNWIRTTGATRPNVYVCDFEAQAGNVAKINRPEATWAYETSNGNFDASGHPTDTLTPIMGATWRGVFTSNPSLLNPTTSVGSRTLSLGLGIRI